MRNSNQFFPDSQEMVGVEHHILFLGNNHKSFQFVRQVLDRDRYGLFFSSFDEFKTDSSKLDKVDLIIIDAVPLSSENLNLVYSLKKNPSFSQIPVLALADEQPPRLKYRLVEAGVDDYQTIPFDKLDLQTKIKNLMSRNNNNHLQHDNNDNNHDNNNNGDNNQNNDLQKLVEQPGAPNLVKTVGQLLKGFNLPLLNFNSDKLLENLLGTLNKTITSEKVLLFEIRDRDFIVPKYIVPDGIVDEQLMLTISNFPILEKAINVQKPILLNTASNLEGPLVGRLSYQLNMQISSIVVFPLVISEKVSSLLMILRTDQGQFRSDDYQTVQIFSELISHAIYIDDIKQIEKRQLDRESWHFYYDFLERIVNKLDFGIMVLDSHHMVKFLNEKAAEIFRIPKEDILYNPLSSILSEDEAYGMLTFKEKDVSTLERPELVIEVGEKEKILLGFSVYYYIDEKTMEEEYIISLKDITERKELEDEKKRNERLESLGMVATGIAHEIRNPLAGIKAISQTLEEELSNDDSRKEYIDRIIGQVNRLDDLLKNLYQFAKPAKPNQGFWSIEDILRDVIRSFRENLKLKNIQLIETLHSNLPEVYIDDKQISQVIANLIKNSIQATNPGGEIRVIIKSLDSSQILSNGHLKSVAQDKPYVEIHIQDTGDGIPPTNLDKIFDPYFTTKISSTGLGLSIAYQTVKKNGGLIHFENREQGGTDCTLILPASD